MAHVEFRYCNRCESTTNHTNRKCVSCADREHREKVAAWNALTNEEKLQDLRQRLEKLERGEPTY